MHLQYIYMIYTLHVRLLACLYVTPYDAEKSFSWRIKKPVVTCHKQIFGREPKFRNSTESSVRHVSYE